MQLGLSAARAQQCAAHLQVFWLKAHLQKARACLCSNCCKRAAHSRVRCVGAQQQVTTAQAQGAHDCIDGGRRIGHWHNVGPLCADKRSRGCDSAHKTWW